MTPELETPRLLLRALTLEDAARVQELFPHWEIVRHLDEHVPWPYPADEAYRFIGEVTLPAVERGELWAWTLRLKTAPEELIGMINVQRGEYHRGFWLGLEWQGRGLMTEAANAVTDFWFGVLEMPVMRVAKAVGNAGSRRISEKQGMRVVEVVEREYVSGRHASEVWEITAEEWKARRSD